MKLFRKNKNASIVHEPGKQRLSLAEIQNVGFNSQIRDMSNTLWFPAGQPVPSVAPKGTPPRRYAYQPLANINFSGRDGAVNFATLRRFSDYTICRAIIESVLDRLCSEKWDFRLVAQDDESKADYKKRNASDPRIRGLKQFFLKPDGWQNFRTWSRGLYDDMLVLDAASVWLQRDDKNRIAALCWIDGAQVFPLIDETGNQPSAGKFLAQTANKKADKNYIEKAKAKGGKVKGDPASGTQSVEGGSPAFQLTPYGFPAQTMTANELIYAVRNRKTFKKFGLSIVEQSLSMIALGLGRQDFQAAYYTSGNVPEFIAFLPPDCPPSKAEELNGYLDSILSGQARNRRKGFFLPSYGSEKSPNIVFPKANDEVLKDAFDEWIARVMCYFFGMSPTAFIKQVNRATAQQQSEESEEQGLQPYLDWFGDLLNEIVQFQFGFDDIEAVSATRIEQDALKQAQIDDIRLTKGVKTLNDIREQNGDDPFDIPEAGVPMIYTATGAVPLGVDHQIDQAQTKIKAGVIPDPNKPPEPNGPPGKQPPKKKVLALKSAIPEDDPRHSWPTMSPGVLSTKSHAARVRIETAIQKCFRAQKSAAVKALLAHKVSKAEDSPSDEEDFSQREQEVIDAAWSEVQPYYDQLPYEMRQSLEDAALSGVQQGVLQLSIDDASLINSFNDQATEYARARAAELVGMSHDGEGNLIPNPDAKWAISDTTRQDLRDLIADAFQGNTNWEDIVTNIKAAIENERVFSDARAEMIARTEIGHAQGGSTWNTWQKSGLVQEVQWLCTGDDPCALCLANDGVTVNLGETFPSGAHNTTESHPNCQCTVLAVGLFN